MPTLNVKLSLLLLLLYVDMSAKPTDFFTSALNNARHKQMDGWLANHEQGPIK